MICVCLTVLTQLVFAADDDDPNSLFNPTRVSMQVQGQPDRNERPVTNTSPQTGTNQDYLINFTFTASDATPLKLSIAAGSFEWLDQFATYLLYAYGMRQTSSLRATREIKLRDLAKDYEAMDEQERRTALEDVLWSTLKWMRYAGPLSDVTANTTRTGDPAVLPSPSPEPSTPLGEEIVWLFRGSEPRLWLALESLFPMTSHGAVQRAAMQAAYQIAHSTAQYLLRWVRRTGRVGQLQWYITHLLNIAISRFIGVNVKERYPSVNGFRDLVNEAPQNSSSNSLGQSSQTPQDMEDLLKKAGLATWYQLEQFLGDRPSGQEMDALERMNQSASPDLTSWVPCYYTLIPDITSWTIGLDSTRRSEETEDGITMTEILDPNRWYGSKFEVNISVPAAIAKRVLSWE